MGTKDNGSKDNVHGEGNYEASRQYNSATKRFVESGRVEQAARGAEPRSGKEAAEMEQAEHAALLRAKHAPDGSIDDALDDVRDDAAPSH